PFWWMLDAVRRSGLDLDRFWAIQVRPIGDGYTSLGVYTSEELFAFLPQREPITAALLHAGAELWRKFASSFPAELDEARRLGCPLFPDLGNVGEWFARLFPRLLLPERQLRLSLLDQAFLDQLSARVWRRPIDLLARDFC